MADFHPFSNPEQIAKDLLEFKATDWNGCSLIDVSDDYIRRFQSLPAYPITVKAGTIIFRGRLNNGSNSEPYSKLSDLGLIPVDKVRSFGRANIPQHPVFYCSNNEETVVKEVTQWYINDSGRAQDLFTKKIIGMDWNPWTAMMTISAWRIKEDLTLALLFGNESCRNNGVQEYAQNRYNLMDGETAGFNRSRNLIIDFFSEEFMQLQVSHESQYLFSALYAFDIMNNPSHLEWRGLRFDGVKYPSIANDFRGENYAISENAYKNKVEFLGANYCYTCNNENKIMDVNTSALIGRVYSTIAKTNGELTWGESTNDFDYLAHYQGKIYPFSLINIPNRFSKAVITLKA